MRCFDGVVAVVDADNDAHGKYLLSFNNCLISRDISDNIIYNDLIISFKLWVG